ncbi:hypothetical protein GCM10010174_00680 [Kutzneria viridogrisea]|uniref:Methyltransferase domain-containing protein n=2 Tax=Kutzneria TaxID=43356 RepID=W5WA72_9PSEU|nr:class I SAM-dependent methyltransferase [Kutzneria albida]AHH97827.1 hypothetical protein KALB_4465 [Kutzneria albida DSM 43870]MBA8924586.1 SAM-dependent methyltransferase [Kutzneria viridogrisea]
MAEPAPFDRIGANYDASRADRSAHYAANAWLADRLSPGARVLDVGCGSGEPTARELCERGFEVVGVDESGVMLDLARAGVPGATFLQRDFRDLGEDLGQFDAVTAFFALLLVSRAEVAQVLADLRSRLRGPKLLVMSMVYGDFDAFPISFLGVWIPVTAYPTDQLLEVVTAAGFRVLDKKEAVLEAEEAGRLETHQYLFLTAD